MYPPNPDTEHEHRLLRKGLLREWMNKETILFTRLSKFSGGKTFPEWVQGILGGICKEGVSLHKFF
jgi:hypothetical protein